jgi:nucleoside 2-deoxyribosyltransferase
MRDSLSEFCDVYLPQEDGALLMDLIASGKSIVEASEIVFARDLAAIERCDVLLLNMDGRIVDEGACFELGYAYSRGKICIGVKTDVRSLLPVGDNPMIECALRARFGSFTEAREWLWARRWERN